VPSGCASFKVIDWVICLAAVHCADSDDVDTVENACIVWYASVDLTMPSHFAFTYPICTPGVVGGVVILPSMSQLVQQRHHHEMMNYGFNKLAAEWA
jgi:hypothetical protein